jgi:serpin B
MFRATHTLPILLLALTSVGAAACGSASPEGASATNPTLDRVDDARDPAVTGDIPTAVDANNAFALSLYGQVVPTAAGGNFLMSPLSATLALTMTYAGAQGTTASQMASVLHIPSSGTSIFDAQNALTQALAGRATAALAADQRTAKDNQATAPSPSDYILNVVNSVWGQTGYPWANPFLTILAKSYGTGVYVENFELDPAPAETAINQWVSTETAGKINPLLAPDTLSTATRMVLVNAIHLKLPWASPFETNQTTTGTFTRGDGTTVQANFMNQSYESYESGAGYADTSAGQFVSLPLSGNQLSVVFALPKKDLASLTASLTKDSFAVQGASALYLSLPKFTFVSNTFSLADALKTLGMTDAFNSVKADFKGICPATPDGENLYIADVLQKATLDVAENGVEAAAATAVLVSTAAAEENPITVTIDRPFLVSIVDSSGAILFLGQINDPTDSGS